MSEGIEVRVATDDEQRAALERHRDRFFARAVAKALDAWAYDDTTDDERRVLMRAAALIRRKLSE